MAQADFLLTDTCRRPRLAGLAVAPGLAVCAAITGASLLLQTVEVAIFGRAWLEALVIAILLGAAIRTFWTPGPLWQSGIDLSARLLLEIAVVLLGATISAGTIINSGLPLLAGIGAVVCVALTASYGLGRLFGLPHRMATLIACGNSICGNSAIAAVAPVIGADSEDVTTSIAFTAVLGVAAVLGLPLLASALHMTPRAFGVFAGLTVYAVPQVLAATAPVSLLSTQIGAVVKLVRVLMLGPVVLGLSLVASADRTGKPEDGQGVAPRVQPKAGSVSAHQLVPWFIIGFLGLVCARTIGAIPTVLLAPAAQATTWLTIISMAALGLGVDVKMVARAGVRVTAVVTLSLLALGVVAMALIRLLGLS